MGLDEAFGNRESEPGAYALRLLRLPISLEDMLEIFLRNPGPVVTDDEFAGVSGLLRGAVERCVVDGKGHTAANLRGDGEVMIDIPAAGITIGSEQQRSQYPAAGGKRDDDL